MKLVLLLLLILILFLFVKPTVTILLTCTVNTGKNINSLVQTDSQERKRMYLSSIKNWLEKTSFNIVVVDNSNYTFPEITNTNRFEKISYSEDSLPEPSKTILENDPSKGTHELYAINYAFDNSKLLKKSDFIIKVTGRYFIPDLIKYIKYPLPDFIRQNNPTRCEIVGCKKKWFRYLFNPKLEYQNNEYNNDFIEIIYKRRIDGKNSVVLPDLTIPATKTGSGGNIVTSL
jgi:hypothetical protein